MKAAILAVALAAAVHPVPIGHGHSRYGNYSISGYSHGGTLCLNLKAGALSDAGCGFLDFLPGAADPDVTGDCTDHTASFIGTASDAVSAVQLKYASGRTLRARLFPIPASVAAHRKVYVAFAGTTRKLRWVDAYDAAGHRIQHTRATTPDPCVSEDPFKGASIIGTGKAPDGAEYQFRAARSRDDSGKLSDCLGLRERTDAQDFQDRGSSCQYRIGDDDVQLSEVGTCKPGAETYLFGYAIPAVHRLVLQLDGGLTADAQLYPAPASFHTADQLVLAAVAGAHRVRAATAYDASGAQVFSHQALSEPGGLCEEGGSFATSVEF